MKPALLLTLLAAAISARAGTVSVNASASYFAFGGTDPACTATIDQSGRSVAVSLRPACVPGDAAHPTISGSLDDFSGTLTLSGCDQHLAPLGYATFCSGSFFVSGYYLFNGPASFNFGLFSGVGPQPSWSIGIDGQSYFGLPTVPVTIQPGTIHFITFSARFNAGEDGFVSYSFFSPGVFVTPLATPEPSGLFLCAAGLLAIIGKRL